MRTLSVCADHSASRGTLGSSRNSAAVSALILLGSAVNWRLFFSMGLSRFFTIPHFYLDNILSLLNRTILSVYHQRMTRVKKLLSP
jgi:hypothetical protein